MIFARRKIVSQPVSVKPPIEIVTVVFGHQGGENTNPKFQRLLSAWCLSCCRSNPDATITIIESERPNNRGMKAAYADNTHKLHLWRDYLKTKAEGDVVFLDCDMIVLRDLREGFEELGGDWDAAWTRRSGKDYINGGTVFCRKTVGAESFMSKWCDINDSIFESEEILKRHLTVHAGLNQTSLYKMLNDGLVPTNCKLVDLPCLKYNCCDQHWHEFDRSVAVLHVKSSLQRVAMKNTLHESAIGPRWKKCAQVYREYDRTFRTARALNYQLPKDKVRMVRM